MARTARYLHWTALAALALLVSGCAATHSAQNWAAEEVYGPHTQPAPRLEIDPYVDPGGSIHPVSRGSLWTNASVNVFGDDKAFRPGDTILVNVMQSNTASSKANTSTSRKSGISAAISYLLGLEQPAQELVDYSGSPASAPNLVEAESESTFDGSGTTDRADSLQATVSAVVTDVLSNGNLVVYGHQTVQVNNEASVLTVQGVVRPSDISEDNSVASTRLANANIVFSGSGVVTDRQHPGWLTRVFDWAWPL